MDTATPYLMVLWISLMAGETTATATNRNTGLHMGTTMATATATATGTSTPTVSAAGCLPLSRVRLGPFPCGGCLSKWCD